MARPAPQIIKLQNPNVLLIDEVHALFERAFNNTREAPPWSEELRAELIRSIDAPAFHVWIGEERNKFKGLMIAILPTSYLHQRVWLYLAYNEGTQRLHKQMTRVLIDFLRSHGYSHASAINTAMDEKTYARLFKDVGELRKTGTVMEFTL